MEPYRSGRRVGPGVPGGGRAGRGRAGTRAGGLLLLALGILGCGQPKDVALAKEGPSELPLEVPVPAADGPKLVALEATPILAAPKAEGAALGALRPGSVVARSASPYGRAGCAGGWHAVRPRGFVCAGPGVSLEPALAAGLPRPPDLAKALPYRYGRTRTEGVQVYGRLPYLADQEAAEPDLAKHVARAVNVDAEVLGPAANDVPLDARGVPTGPAVLLPSGEGVGEKGKRTIGSFFTFPEETAPVWAMRLDLPVKAAVLRRQSGVAIASAYALNDGTRVRRFGVTPESTVVPLDRLRPALGSQWHGVDLEKTGLPVAFVHKRDVLPWHLEKGKASKGEEEFERRTAIPLTGRFRTVEGVRYEETRDGAWVRGQDVIMIFKRHAFPDFVQGSQKWIDVSLANQTLVAWEGKKPVFATLISSGRDVLGDPAQTASTAKGTFRIKAKHVTRDVDPREVYGAFDVGDAPWVAEFEEGFAFTGNYWSDPIGEAQGFHNVALTPIDARRLFFWSDPPLPDGWTSVVAGPEEGTIVHVRP